MTTHQNISGTFVTTCPLIGPGDPPPPPTGDVIFFLPNDNTTSASPNTSALYVFVMPDDCVLTRASLLGDPATLGTFSFLPSPTPIDVDLFIDGVFIQTLFTIPAGPTGTATTVELLANPNVPIPAGAEIQFGLPFPPSVTFGGIGNFVFSFSVGPT